MNGQRKKRDARSARRTRDITVQGVKTRRAKRGLIRCSMCGNFTESLVERARVPGEYACLTCANAEGGGRL